MTRIVRWDPFRDLVNVQSEMNSLMGALAGRPGDVVSGQWAPPIDVREEEDRFVVQCDLPGLTSEDIEITLDQNLLSIAGERRWSGERNDDGYHRVERRYGAFRRTITMPVPVDADGIQASTVDGVLEVIVPKAEQAKPKRIKVGTGARQLGS